MLSPRILLPLCLLFVLCALTISQVTGQTTSRGRFRFYPGTTSCNVATSSDDQVGYDTCDQVQNGTSSYWRKMTLSNWVLTQSAYSAAGCAQANLLPSSATTPFVNSATFIADGACHATDANNLGVGYGSYITNQPLPAPVVSSLQGRFRYFPSTTCDIHPSSDTSMKLDTCGYITTGVYQKLTLSGTTLTQGFYSDSACMTLLSAAQVKPFGYVVNPSTETASGACVVADAINFNTTGSYIVDAPLPTPVVSSTTGRFRFYPGVTACSGAASSDDSITLGVCKAIKSYENSTYWEKLTTASGKMSVARYSDSSCSTLLPVATVGAPWVSNPASFTSDSVCHVTDTNNLGTSTGSFIVDAPTGGDGMSSAERVTASQAAVASAALALAATTFLL